MRETTLLQNFFAIGYKPPNVSSLRFANALKAGLKQIGFPVQKIGFSGTLDPFAHGMLLFGINGYTKLLSHIPKQYKTYKAVLFLGLESKSLDIENIVQIHELQAFHDSAIQNAIKDIQGLVTYKPPKYSAKHINGVRAYELMRKGVDFDIKAITTEIISLKILHYTHPFLSFEICMSEGGYVRSIGAMIAKNLGVHGSLCSLERVQEGQWHYHNICASHKESEQINTIIQKRQNTPTQCLQVPLYMQGIHQNAKVILLNIKNALNYDTIQLTEYAKEAYNGAKFILSPYLCAKIFDDVVYNPCMTQSQNIQEAPLESGYHNKEVCPNNMRQDSISKIMLADFGIHFGIIEVFRNGKVKYILNRIDKC